MRGHNVRAGYTHRMLALSVLPGRSWRPELANRDSAAYGFVEVSRCMAEPNGCLNRAARPGRSKSTRLFCRASVATNVKPQARASLTARADVAEPCNGRNPQLSVFHPHLLLAGDCNIVHEQRILFDKLKGEDWVGPWTRSVHTDPSCSHSPA